MDMGMDMGMDMDSQIKDVDKQLLAQWTDKK